MKHVESDEIYNGIVETTLALVYSVKFLDIMEVSVSWSKSEIESMRYYLNL